MREQISPIALPDSGGHQAKARPRIALIGPKGSGKTMYREWLERNSPPPWLLHLLRASDLKEPEVFTLTPGQNSYVLDPELRATGHVCRSDELPLALPTDKLTLLEVGTPGNRVHVLDFPGEWLVRPGEKGYFHNKTAWDNALLEECKLIVFFFPFWGLIPAPFRAEKDLIGEAIHRRLGQPPPLLADRIDPLFEKGVRWTSRLNEVMDGAARPTLLLVLSMLGRDWPLWLRAIPSPERRAIEERLKHIRALLVSKEAQLRDAAKPRVNVDDEPSSPDFFSRTFAEFPRAARGARLRALLAQLDREVAGYVSDMVGAAGSESSGDEFRQRFAELIQTAGPERVQYMAMNVVSERYRRSDSARLEYLKKEPAGAGLPLVHLLARVDELA